MKPNRQRLTISILAVAGVLLVPELSLIEIHFRLMEIVLTTVILVPMAVVLWTGSWLERTLATLQLIPAA